MFAIPRDRLLVLIELACSDTRTGAVNDALDLAHLAGPLGARLVLCGRLDDGMRALAERQNIPTLQGKSRSISKLGFPLYVASVLLWVVRLLRLRPDVVHLNYAGYCPSLACAAHFCRIPVVSRAGGAFIAKNLANRWITAYVANCEPHAQLLLGSPLADRVYIMGDLFRRDRLDEAAAPGRPLPPRREGRPCFLFLGQLVERKGLAVLIEAFSQADLDADLWLVGGDWGEPGYPNELRALIARLGIGGHIHLENHRPDVAALLKHCDVFVLPSLSDARPRCIIEAMLLGRPVISTSVGGIPTLIEDGVTGILVPPADPQALSRALRLLAGSCDLRRRLGEGGRRRAEAGFQPERTARKYVELYRKLAASASGFGLRRAAALNPPTN